MQRNSRLNSSWACIDWGFPVSIAGNSMPMTPTLAFSACGLFLLFCNLWMAYRQPSPYMDELFHVRQAEAFCKSFPYSFPPYDPSITTPPLLYIIPALLHVLFNRSIPCSTQTLRMFSAMAYLLTFPLLFAILRKLSTRSRFYLSTADATWTVIVLWLHPVGLFYSHLFYTDTLAVLMFLLCWYFALASNHIISAFFGILSAATRQTNILFHAYAAVQTIILPLISGILNESTFRFQLVLRQLWSHIFACGLYVMFLILNQGIALGDKQNHQVRLHFAMVAYFLGFHTLSFLPFSISRPLVALNHLKLIITRPPYFLSCLATCVVIAGMIQHTGGYAHPFVLSDNRHYTFYLYKKWFLRSAWHRLVLVPVYAWGLTTSMMDKLSYRDQYVNVWTAIIEDSLAIGCGCVVVLGVGLLEPRYFLVGSLVLTLQRISRVRERGRRKWFKFIVVGLLVMNIALLYVFLEMPFNRPVDPHMPEDTSPGRFMF